MNFVFHFFCLSLLLFLFRIQEALFHWPQSFSEMNVFLIGYRFDLLVLSFLLIPIVLLQFVVNVRHKLISHLTRGYLFFSWLFFMGLYFLNSFLFSTLKDRIWLQDWVNITQHLKAAFQNQSLFFLVGLLIFSITVFVCGLRQLMCLNQFALNTRKRSVSFAMLLLLAFFARGSLGHDHLRRNDCDFKSSSRVRAFCLNPAYTFSKLKNNEF